MLLIKITHNCDRDIHLTFNKSNIYNDDSLITTEPKIEKNNPKV